MTVARDGRVVWHQAYGYADVEARVPADARTLYRVGSISKTITAVAILRASAAVDVLPVTVGIEASVESQADALRGVDAFDEIARLRGETTRTDQLHVTRSAANRAAILRGTRETFAPPRPTLSMLNSATIVSRLTVG